MKRNDQVYGVCSGYSHDGHGVVKIDGFPLFVKGMLEGKRESWLSRWQKEIWLWQADEKK